jgi:hypothetical protein
VGPEAAGATFTPLGPSITPTQSATASSTPSITPTPTITPLPPTREPAAELLVQSVRPEEVTLPIYWLAVPGALILFGLGAVILGRRRS